MTPTDIPVTLTFIAICAALLVPFTAWIGTYRGAHNILRGDGGDPVLFKRIRAHGNFIETAPLIALAIFAAETMGLSAGWLWAAVASFAIGRVMHWVIYDNKARGGAMFLVTAPGLLLGVWVLLRLWT
ncbi:MAPEG family protein [Celeribacter arenosi]|uniref:MAPEG family protein n=1 Tax=Celeribacter arenosi TaxID=792649 RepID=A0ABP7K2E1_9RHOB